MFYAATVMIKYEQLRVEKNLRSQCLVLKVQSCNWITLCELTSFFSAFVGGVV